MEQKVPLADLWPKMEQNWSKMAQNRMERELRLGPQFCTKDIPCLQKQGSGLNIREKPFFFMMAVMAFPTF